MKDICKIFWANTDDDDRLIRVENKNELSLSNFFTSLRVGMGNISKYGGKKCGTTGSMRDKFLV